MIRRIPHTPHTLPTEGEHMGAEREGWCVWVGMEIEGQHFGIETCFIHDRHPTVTPKQIMLAYRSFYFTSNYIGQFGIDDTVRYALSLGLVTLEVTPEQLEILPNDICKTCNIILYFEISPNVQAKLKPYDSIRINGAPYAPWLALSSSFTKITPEMYNGDQVRLRK